MYSMAFMCQSIGQVEPEYHYLGGKTLRIDIQFY